MRLLPNTVRPSSLPGRPRRATRRRLSFLTALAFGLLALAGCGDVTPIRDAFSPLTSQSTTAELAAGSGGVTVGVADVQGLPNSTLSAQTPSTPTPTTGPARGQATNTAAPATQPARTPTPTTGPAGGRVASAPTATEQPTTARPGAGQPAADQPTTQPPTTRSAAAEPTAGAPPDGSPLDSTPVAPAPTDTGAGEAAGASGPADGESGDTESSATSVSDQPADAEADADLAAPIPTDGASESGTTVSEGVLSEAVPLEPGATTGTDSSVGSPSSSVFGDGELSEIVPTADQNDDRSWLGATTWLIITAIVAATIAAFLVVTNSSERPPDAIPPGPNRLQRQLRDVVDGANWIHDSGSVELLRSNDPRQARARWSEIRRLMLRIESRIATIAVGTGDPVLDQNLRQLGQCLAELRGAEEGYVTAKLRAAGAAARSQSEQRLQTANQAVMAHRQQLLEAIEPVAYPLRG